MLYGTEHRVCRKAMQDIERGPKEVYGLKVRGTNTLLSDIAWRLETEQGVDLVLSAYPGLTREDAEAALRMLTVVLLSLDAGIIDDE